MRHIYPIFDKIVSAEEKGKRYRQRPICIWLTGLSGSRKIDIGGFVRTFFI